MAHARAACSPPPDMRDELEHALTAARRDHRDLTRRSRALFDAAVACAVLLVAYVITAAAGLHDAPFGLGLGLLAGTVVGLGTLGARASRRARLADEDATVLAVARDAVDYAPGSGAPYRTGTVASVGVHTGALERRRRDGAKPVPERPSFVARLVAAALCATALVAALAFVFADGPSARRHWTFVETAASAEALGLETPSLLGGEWALEDDASATGARALVNRAAGEGPPAMLVARGVRARDVRAVTRCRPSTTDDTAACGLVFRWVDPANHHVVRFEASTGRVVLAAVSHGAERVLGTSVATGTTTGWQQLAVEARGGTTRVTWNGHVVVETHDARPIRAGSVGLWVPARSEAAFDEMSVETFAAMPDLAELLPILRDRASGARRDPPQDDPRTAVLAPAGATDGFELAGAPRETRHAFDLERRHDVTAPSHLELMVFLN